MNLGKLEPSLHGSKPGKDIKRLAQKDDVNSKTFEFSRILRIFSSQNDGMPTLSAGLGPSPGWGPVGVGALMGHLWALMG